MNRCNPLLMLAAAATLVAVLIHPMWFEAADDFPAYAPGQLLIRFKLEATELDRAAALSEVAAQWAHTFQSRAELWLFDPEQDVESTVTALQANPLVEYVEPNYYISLCATEPDDPNFANQWALKNTGQTVNGTAGTADADIDAELAWDITTGSSNVIVAVIGTGVDYTHDDLMLNCWYNPDEALDDDDEDGNGFVDDLHGWDFTCDPNTYTCRFDNDPLDTSSSGHETLVSGVMGAVADNNQGIAGVSWDVSLMALKVVPDHRPPRDFTGIVSDAVKAIEYAVLMEADIINISASTPDFSQTFEDALLYANEHNVVVVVSAGNGGTDLDDPNTEDAYPAEFDLGQHDGLLTVAATDQNDDAWGQTNYGHQSVDLGGPGENILSTKPEDVYEYVSGTSLAAPHVSGVAALLRALNNQMPPELIKRRILESVDPIAALDPNGQHPVVSGGRLNAFAALDDQDTVEPAAIGSLTASASTWHSVSLGWIATGDDGSTGTAALNHMRYSTASIDESSFFTATLAGGEPDPDDPNTPQTMTVNGLSPATVYYFALKSFDEWGNGPISNVVSCGTNPGSCTTSFCKPDGEEGFRRCTFTGSFPTCSSCCPYTCVLDETCTQADPCPDHACSAACS